MKREKLFENNSIFWPFIICTYFPLYSPLLFPSLFLTSIPFSWEISWTSAVLLRNFFQFITFLMPKGKQKNLINYQKMSFWPAAYTPTYIVEHVVASWFFIEASCRFKLKFVFVGISFGVSWNFNRPYFRHLAPAYP